ncbi:M48 family metallopeptidase [Microbulbifer pacificus]|uniref:M48 family metallopeptidase n=1 Tax=Microbulbifer pacificus TaxID=407164 RepID=UPI000CF3B128|nr:M48 family metallopeptidase [Microbulbifer pacificus]
MSDSLTIQGTWQDGTTSAVLPAQLRCVGGQVYLFADGRELLRAPATQVALSPKLGRTPRYLSFGDRAGQLESSDHDNLDRLDRLVGSRGYGILHRLENHLGMVVLATLMVVVIVWGYFTWGVPAGSKALANRLPPDLLDRSAQETLEFLEEYSFEPSALSPQRQAEIRAEFGAFAPDYPIEKLRFYRGGDQGANAFALPNGTIIFTDEIVALANSSEELLAVFGHELGHVKYRHSLRQVIQGSAFSLTIALVTGEVSALGDLLLTAPLVFTQLSYSRQFELESDAYAVELLRENGRSPKALADILSKLYHSKRCEDKHDCREVPGEDANSDSEHRNHASWLRYLSTHPHLEERIALTRGMGE